MIGLDAGRLRYRIRIERATMTELPSGEEEPTWAQYSRLSADISFGKGVERREAAQDSASAPATFHVRRNSKTATITPKDRLIFDGSTWDITSAVPSKKFRAGVDITAVRKAA